MLSNRAEIERIRNSLTLTAELLAAQLVLDVAQGSPIKLAHLAIRLPSVISRLRRLIVACETILDRIATTESRLLAGMVLDIGITSGLVLNPPVQLSTATRIGEARAPGTLAAISERLKLLEGTSTIRIERYANSAIAYIPGTSSASFGWTNNPMDMKTNLQQLSGRRSNVEMGLGQALAAAGVKPTDSVMLVGHSQGGLVAISAAEHSKTGNFPFSISKVITFGSPVGANIAEKLPSVLSVENKFDFVPKLDGKSNPNAPNWLTLRGEVAKDPVAAHEMESYLTISGEIDQTGEAQEFSGFAAGEAEVSHFKLNQGLDMRG